MKIAGKTTVRTVKRASFSSKATIRSNCINPSHAASWLIITITRRTSKHKTGCKRCLQNGASKWASGCSLNRCHSSHMNALATHSLASMLIYPPTLPRSVIALGSSWLRVLQACLLWSSLPFATITQSLHPLLAPQACSILLPQNSCHGNDACQNLLTRHFNPKELWRWRVEWFFPVVFESHIVYWIIFIIWRTITY